MFGSDEKGHPDMGKVITEWHCDRLNSLIQTSKGRVVCGGKVNKDIKHVEPTIIENPDLSSPVMQEEIFGPIVPIITFKDFN